MCLNLVNEKWDIAIVLDACRFDTFKKLHRKYLPKGRLSKRKGTGQTSEWLKSNFSEYQDLVFVASIPAINEQGIKFYGYDATGKFFKLYEAFIDGFNEELGTVPPDYVVEVGTQAMIENPNKRIIIQFLQPHYPYRKTPKMTHKKLRHIIGNVIDRFSMTTIYQKVRIKMGYTNFRNPEAYTRHKELIQELIELYEDNLDWALENIASLLKRIKNKKVVITSDHGEAFGEDGNFFHLSNIKSDAVRTVPFYELEL